MYAKYARTARKTLQKMLTIKEITSIIMHHLPSIQIEDCGSRNKPPTVIGMPSVFYYTTLREKCQTKVFNKKALDKQGVLAYNRNRKSIPVDGLLPLFELKKDLTAASLVASGAVISFSCRGDSGYYFYDYSKCKRSNLPDSAEHYRSLANHQR